MMRKTIPVILATIGVMALVQWFANSPFSRILYALWTMLPVQFGGVEAVPPSPPPSPIEIVRNVGELTTTRVHVTDYIEGENNQYKGRWLLHGEVLLGVDLSDVTYAAIDEVKRTVSLALPAPHVVATKVDHERSTEISFENKIVVTQFLAGRTEAE